MKKVVLLMLIGVICLTLSAKSTLETQIFFGPQFTWLTGDFSVIKSVVEDFKIHSVGGLRLGISINRYLENNLFFGHTYIYNERGWKTSGTLDFGEYKEQFFTYQEIKYTDLIFNFGRYFQLENNGRITPYIGLGVSAILNTNYTKYSEGFNNPNILAVTGISFSRRNFVAGADINTTLLDVFDNQKSRFTTFGMNIGYKFGK